MGTEDLLIAAQFLCMILIDLWFLHWNLASYFVMLAIWVRIPSDPDSRAVILYELEMKNIRTRLVIQFLVKFQFSWSVGLVFPGVYFV